MSFPPFPPSSRLTTVYSIFISSSVSSPPSLRRPRASRGVFTWCMQSSGPLLHRQPAALLPVKNIQYPIISPRRSRCASGKITILFATAVHLNCFIEPSLPPCTVPLPHCTSPCDLPVCNWNCMGVGGVFDVLLMDILIKF